MPEADLTLAWLGREKKKKKKLRKGREKGDIGNRIKRYYKRIKLTPFVWMEMCPPRFLYLTPSEVTQFL